MRKRLKAARKAAGMTQQQVAARLGKRPEASISGTTWRTCCLSTKGFFVSAPKKPVRRYTERIGEKDEGIERWVPDALLVLLVSPEGHAQDSRNLRLCELSAHSRIAESLAEHSSSFHTLKSYVIKNFSATFKMSVLI